MEGKKAEGNSTAIPGIKLNIGREDPIAKLTRLYELLGPQQPCFHAVEANHFAKRRLSLNIEYQDEKQKESEVQKGCILCYANGFRTGISATLKGGSNLGSELENILKIPQESISVVSFNTGLALGCKDGEMKAENNQWNWPITALYDEVKSPPEYSLQIKAGEYGEIFHVLFAKLFQPRISVTNKKSGDLFAAFCYYGIQDAQNPQSDGKDHATAVLSQAFAKRVSDQETLFSALRTTLERLYVPENPSFTDIAIKSPGYYCGVSYLGKYWINRFFTLTKQGVSKADGKRWQLPKKDTVSRMALIYIRKQGPKGASGRSMTDENVSVCLKAIACANSAAALDKTNSARFSHILFFGDFETEREAKSLKKLVLKTPGLNFSEDDKILYITKPWMPTADVKDPIKEFWAEYQAEVSSEPKGSKLSFASVKQGAPLQIRHMAMFLALQARYKESLCAIGFRCGYLDLAGFVGIPTFFVDAAWAKKDLKNLIYLPAKNDTRMVDASNKINTFIRIDFLAPRGDMAQAQSGKNTEVKSGKNKEVKSGKKGQEKVGAEDNRNLEPLWDMHKDKDKGKDEEGNEPVDDRLAAALYVYMLARLHNSGPLWKQRVKLLQEEGEIKNGKGPLQSLLENVISSKKH